MLKDKWDPEDRATWGPGSFFSIFICSVYVLGLFILFVWLLNKERADELWVLKYEGKALQSHLLQETSAPILFPKI